MKLNAYATSGSSPGLLDIKHQIEAAFERARTLPSSPLPSTPHPSLQPKAEAVYTQRDEARFEARAQRLISESLGNPYICKPRSNVFHIAVPDQTADEIIAEIMGGRE